MKYLIFSILIVMIACKPEVEVNNLTPTKVETEETKSIDPLSVALSSTDLTAHAWEIDMVLDNGKVSQQNEWKGNTITFDIEGNYTWMGNGIKDNGTYNLDAQKNIILLSSEEPVNNSEWSVKHRRSMMVWIGTPKFSHHSLQLKLVKK